MDTASIASFLVASQQQNTRLNVATAVMKMSQQQDQQLLSMIDKGLAQSTAASPPPPEGMGQKLDMTV
ncbi:hypothetical protein [Oryzibacter oryziterrae]|uniref:hypothetical protein n=1 Tax=Oryzibacter oryziterrae TaxID=2766474 RepID=UPI001F3C9A63|nr:hypothetical protein [Oryzibacter oryziterrae]